MEKSFSCVKNLVYDVLGFQISELKEEKESKEYEACSFKINELHIISRASKITPKKVGQFVTFWKRCGNGPIEPFNESDDFDFYVVNVAFKDRLGQFVFPKAILLKKGIVSSSKKEGKRGFRVYPVWDVVKSKQAEKTQQWQLDYFYEINTSIDLKKAIHLYGNV